jgi:hypothetical protein
MSRELDLISAEFKKKPVIVFRKEVNLYGSNIQSACSTFLRSVEMECRRSKQSHVILIAIIPEN